MWDDWIKHIAKSAYVTQEHRYEYDRLNDSISRWLLFTFIFIVNAIVSNVLDRLDCTPFQALKLFFGHILLLSPFSHTTHCDNFVVN